MLACMIGIIILAVVWVSQRACPRLEPWPNKCVNYKTTVTKYYDTIFDPDSSYHGFKSSGGSGAFVFFCSLMAILMSQGKG